MIKSKTQLQTDIEADADFTPEQKGILVNVVDSYQNTFPNVTTVQRNELTPTTGLTVFNTDTARHEYWNGGAWLAIGQNTATPMLAKIEVSSAALLDSGSTPVMLIAAPPAGYCILPLSVYARLNYNSEVYDFVAESTAVVAYSNKEIYSRRLFKIDHSILNASAATTGFALFNNEAGADKLAESDALVLMDTNGGPTQGNGTLTLWITYCITEY